MKDNVKRMKRCYISTSLGNCKLKNNKMLEWSQSQTLTTSKPGEDKEPQELSFIASGMQSTGLVKSLFQFFCYIL